MFQHTGRHTKPCLRVALNRKRLHLSRFDYPPLKGGVSTGKEILMNDKTTQCKQIVKNGAEV